MKCKYEPIFKVCRIRDVILQTIPTYTPHLSSDYLNKELIQYFDQTKTTKSINFQYIKKTKINTKNIKKITKICMQNHVCCCTPLLIEYFLLSLPFNTLIVASTLAVKPILVEWRALLRSAFHIR